MWVLSRYCTHKAIVYKMAWIHVPDRWLEMSWCVLNDWILVMSYAIVSLGSELNYPNQCWLTVNQSLRNESRWESDKNAMIFIWKKNHLKCHLLNICSHTSSHILWISIGWMLYELNLRLFLLYVLQVNNNSEWWRLWCDVRLLFNVYLDISWF